MTSTYEAIELFSAERLMREAEQSAKAFFADLNCTVSVRVANWTAIELRVASNAFEWYGACCFVTGRSHPDMSRMIEGLREQMIENVFRDGGKCRNGYPRGMAAR